MDMEEEHYSHTCIYSYGIRNKSNKKNRGGDKVLNTQPWRQIREGPHDSRGKSHEDEQFVHFLIHSL
jgi:hypothetical protein